MNAGYEAGWHDRDGEIIRWQAKRRRAVQSALYYRKLAREACQSLNFYADSDLWVTGAMRMDNGYRAKKSLEYIKSLRSRDQGESR